MTAKLKLKCLATDRPTPSDIYLLTFYQSDTGYLVGTGLLQAKDDWAQMPAPGDDALFYLEAFNVPTLLCAGDLLELPEKPNPEREAYTKAKNAWCTSSLGIAAIGRALSDTRKLFISHELLKAGYTISDELYAKYC